MDHQFSESDLKKVESFKQEIDVHRPDELSLYGLGSQKNLSRLSEEILSEVRNNQALEVGSLLNQLMLTVRGLELENISEKGLLSRLWHGLLKELSLFRGSFEKVSDQIEDIVVRLEHDKTRLLNDSKALEKIYDQNLSLYRELTLRIKAAEEVIEHKRQQIGEVVNETFNEDYYSAQKIKDEKAGLDQLETRVYDLRLTRTVALQTLPQIRLIQRNNRELVNKIQSTIHNTIPVWKNQVILALSLQKQKKVAEVQREVHVLTNDLLTRNSHMLKENTVEISRMSENGAIDLQALQKVNENLLEVLGTVLNIYQEGKQKRKEAEKELGEMENRLKASLACSAQNL